MGGGRNALSFRTKRDHAEALSTLKIARQLGIWFYRTFAGKPFSAGPFVPPPDPAAATKALQEELERLRTVADQARSEAERARIAAETEARERANAQERARKEAEERAVWEQLGSEAEQAKAEAAAADIDIDEAATRTIISCGRGDGKPIRQPCVSRLGRGRRKGVT
jgi:type I restriction enzyme R subunit